MLRWPTFIILGALMTACSASRQTTPPLRFASIFGDGMVLQRGMSVPVWGRAEPGAAIEVRFKTQRLATRADDAGRWRVDLSPLRASAKPVILRLCSGDAEVVLADVLVGEVWFCGGQSNMEWPLVKTEDGAAVAATADHPLLRYRDVPDHSAAEPQEDCRGDWQVCTPESAGRFAGTAFYFGRELHGTLGVPVGLVHSAWSGACAESWLPLERLEAEPSLAPVVERWREYVAAYPRQQADYERAMAKWKRDGLGKRPRRPQSPTGPERSIARLYNGMLHPVIPLAVRGVAWYQGENNVLHPDDYARLFPCLIRTWRDLWDRSDLPFIYVQVANFGAKQKKPEDGVWPRLRDAQLAGLTEPHTAMVSAIDLGGAFHPKNKRDVGRRLAAAALDKVYGKRGDPWSGPRFAGMERRGAELVLRFAGMVDGLAVRGGGKLAGFTVAGDDRRFAWAEARIEGDTVVVSGARVPVPVAVRYAWAVNPRGNLVDGAGLPCVPFRTDDWEMAAE